MSENRKSFNGVESTSFIDDFVIEDLGPGGRTEGMQVHTRFPPSPNGRLHIGHAKAILISYGLAKRFGGKFNLRIDDTNPAKEKAQFVDAIVEDIKWLGCDWEDRFYYASEYFEDMYLGAIELIEKGLAYVCELTPDQVKDFRGDLSTPAKSPYRNRPIEESMDLFLRMRAGEFDDGKMTLRAKIDLASGNFNMRDPVIYRITRTEHLRTGSEWCIYPMYDYAHPYEDALEHITHSLCSLEFEDHRPFYNWVVENVSRLPSKPRQIEFARLNVDSSITSKRKLRRLIEEGHVSGWDDPRLLTLVALRRRGYTPEAIQTFIVRNGVSKVNSLVEFAFLEYCLREDLNKRAQRVMAVLDPVKLIITNYPENQKEIFTVENNPNCSEDGEREISFGREVWIERVDFMEEPARKYFRLFPGNEVRLKSTYIVKCTGCKKDDAGNVIEVYAEYDPESRGGNAADGRKIKSTIHWVDATNALDAEIRLYDNLFTVKNPDDGGDYVDYINENSLIVLSHCKLEASLEDANVGDSFQFMRQGYFCVDSVDSNPEALVFNRSVNLKDKFKPVIA